MEEVLSDKEAAKFLRISQRKLFDLRKSGALAFRNVGRRVLYAREELLRFMGVTVAHGKHRE